VLKKLLSGWPGQEKRRKMSMIVQDVLTAETRSQRRELRHVLLSVDGFGVFVHMYYAYYQIR